jgi:regulator of PEP synthase PpsR (kinase-PPPase family)
MGTNRNVPLLYIVSGGFGASGEQLARTALAQFSGVEMQVEVVPQVRHVEQVVEAVARAHAGHAAILHTLVNPDLRRVLVEEADRNNVVTIDGIGRLLTYLATVLEREPKGEPGLYRQLREHYFRRVEAIEFTLAHDDSRNAHDLESAEIILVGPSRVGKTPLSIYLSTLGWKTANLALVPKLDPPDELFQVPAWKVVGLLIEPGQLLHHRQRRQRKLGVSRKSPYVDPGTVADELREVKKFFQQHSFPTVDMTDRQIEEGADEVLGLVESRRRQLSPTS